MTRNGSWVYNGRKQEKRKEHHQRRLFFCTLPLNTQHKERWERQKMTHSKVLTTIRMCLCVLRMDDKCLADGNKLKSRKNSQGALVCNYSDESSLGQCRSRMFNGLIFANFKHLWADSFFPHIVVCHVLCRLIPEHVIYIHSSLHTHNMRERKKRIAWAKK